MGTTEEWTKKLWSTYTIQFQKRVEFVTCSKMGGSGYPAEKCHAQKWEQHFGSLICGSYYRSVEWQLQELREPSVQERKKADTG